MQFCRSRFQLRQGKARGEYCRIFKSFNAAWVKICPSKPIAVLLLPAYAKKGGASTNVFVATAWYTQSMPAPPRLDLALAPSFLVPCSFETEIFAHARTKLQSTLTYSQGFGRSSGEKNRFKTVYFIVSAGLTGSFLSLKYFYLRPRAFM